MAPKTDRPLNAKQLKFAYNMASGLTATAAYKDAYKVKNDNTAAPGGARLAKDERILQEIRNFSQENRTNLQETLRKEENLLILTRLQRQNFWTEIALDPKMPINARLKATELLGRSEGDFIENVKITEVPTFVDDVD